jgi:hypothetical protein
MSELTRFAPSYTKGITVAPGVASASSTIGFGSKTIAFTNLSSVLTYVRISSGAATATTADYPILPNAQVWVSKDQDADTVSYIAPAGGGSLHIMPGEGF